MRASLWMFLSVLMWSAASEAAAKSANARTLPPAPSTVAPDYSSFPREMIAIDQSVRATRPPGDQTDWVYFVVYRPTIVVDLSSPSALYTSIYWRNLDSLRDLKSGEVTIGHFETGWSCAARGGLPAMASATGHTGERFGAAIEMLKNGGGMSPLLVDWMDGVLEPANPGGPDPSIPNVSDRIAENHAGIQLIAAAVRPEDCRRVGAFYQEFAARRAYRRFGLYADPAKFEGGVCWSTAEASVAHIPALRSLFSSFNVAFDVPEILVGKPNVQSQFLRLPPVMQGRPLTYVSLDAFNDPDLRWNMPSPKSYPYRTFDFQSFGALSARQFAGCATPWCNMVRQRGGQLYTASTTSRYPVSTLVFDAR